MTSFCDENNRLWNITLNIGSAKLVKERLGVNLFNPNDKDESGLLLTTRLLYDDLFLVEVCKVLMDNQKPPIEEFSGFELKRLDEAFWEEYRLFFAARGKDWVVKAAEADLKERARNAADAIKILNGETLSSSPDAPVAPASND